MDSPWNLACWLWIIRQGPSRSAGLAATAGISRMWSLSKFPLCKRLGLGRLLSHKVFHSIWFPIAWTWWPAKYTGKDTCLCFVFFLLLYFILFFFRGEKLPIMMKKEKFPRVAQMVGKLLLSARLWFLWMALSVSGTDLRPWILLRLTCTILSQVPPRRELIQSCRFHPKDINVCGKAPTNFSTCWICSLDVTAATKHMLTFAMVSNKAISLRAMQVYVYVLAQWAVSVRTSIYLGHSDSKQKEHRADVLHVSHCSRNRGSKNSWETCCFF